TDKTGESIAAALADMNQFLTTKGVTPAELAQTISSQVLSLPGDFEGGDDVMGALIKIETLHRPDDYYVQLPNRYRAMTAADLDKAARAAIDPRNLLWVVVGDAAKVRPQLDKLGMPVELMPLE
ncbi:MAG TPA: insulinase family protein, partial [Allosphingosinicella sp.]|nr:insulinase family protein [Allosphingosinicella sp.]